ncbi:MAG: enoyl-CoA hydratase [Dehalococcoidia bacterium]|nr:enoyl-CoA hydratase [Dehalococcoidia bacterium]
MSDVVLYEQEGAVAILTLNRPEALNAMTGELLTRVAELGEKAATDESVRCVVITGAGRAFCAGGDVKGMAARPADGGGGLVSRVDVLRQQEEISRLLYEMPKPTIAMLNGHAVGAGLSLALAADLRVASDQAKLGTAFARVGFSGDFGGTWLLQRLVGPSKAKELYFLADVMDANRALELGLVSKVVPHDTLREETMALAKRLAAGPTLAYGRMKDNFTFGATNTLADTLTKEAENMIASGQTEDHRNAARAFVEKREPEFVGR